MSERVKENNKRKEHSRINTIITPYRNSFKTKMIPDDKQYWTLSGLCSENGKVKEGSEYDHIVYKEKFCKPEQFYGVESDKDIAIENMKLKEGNWFHDDFYHKMLIAESENNFNPAIINIDTGNMQLKATKLLENILVLISHCEINNVFVILNYVLKCRTNRNSTVNDIVPFLETSRMAQVFRLKSWDYIKEQYTYSGVNNSGTQMATMLFYLMDKPS